MWNWLKTLTETDRDILRDLRSRVSTLEEDVEQCLRTGERINAKLRQRARRAGADSSAGDDSAGDNPEHNINGDGSGIVSFPPLAASPQKGVEDTPVYSKDQLRGFARSRGIRA